MYTISRTPHRVSLFGGATDFESFYSKYESLLLGFAINKYCYLICRHTPKILPHNTSIGYSITERVNDNSELKHDGARGVLQYMGLKNRLEMHVLTDLPARTGLGSSSTFVVGLLNALHHLEGREQPDKKLLAQDAINIERKLLQEPGGIQDQIWAAYGGINSISIKKDGHFFVRPLPVSHEFLHEFKQHLVLLYTGVERQSFKIAKSIDSTDKKTIQNKKKIYQIAQQAYGSFKHENVVEIGQLLNESWYMKRGVSKLISNDKIDKLYNQAKDLGAFGGKLLGSGGSGFLLFIVPPYIKSDFIKNMKLTSVDFNFDFDGSQIETM